MSTMQPERREKVLIHNRGGFVALAAAALVIALAGFGCESERRAVPGGDVPSGGASSDGSTSYTWTTYESPALGITIPYPEGWYVQAQQSEVRFYSAPMPEVPTEYTPEAWVLRERGTIENAIDGLEVVSSEDVIRSGRSMTMITFRDPFYDPPEVLLYIWEDNGFTVEIGGQNRTVVEQMVSTLR